MRKLPGKLPTIPTAESKAAWKARHNNKTTVFNRRHRVPELEKVTLAQVQSYRANAQSQSIVAKELSRIEDPTIKLICASLSTYGFEEFTPDVTEGAYSLYNVAHRNIAIDTFQIANASHGYISFGVNMDYVEDTEYLMAVYDNHLFYYQANLVRQEARKPGSVQKKKEDQKVYRKRKAVRRIHVTSTSTSPIVN